MGWRAGGARLGGGGAPGAQGGDAGAVIRHALVVIALTPPEVMPETHFIYCAAPLLFLDFF